jgi:hypothetical protein
MTERRPIDAIRNSGMNMRVGTVEESGAIIAMFEIDGGFHAIKERAIYRVQLADEIDPQRTNIHLPNINQKVLTVGTDSPLVRQTLMQAKRLFDDHSRALGAAFDYKRGVNIAFDALKDLIVMDTMQADLHAKLKKIDEDLKAMTVRQRSMAVPAIGEVRSLAETFFQKADHAVVDLFDIAKLFYGDQIGKKWFDSLLNLAKEKYGEDDGLAKFLIGVVPLLKFIRNTRNCIEHPKADQLVNVKDITVLPSGQLEAPRIEVIHPETGQPSVPLAILMERIVVEYATIFESMLAYLCDRNVQPVSGLPLQIIEHTLDQQKGFKTRFGYGVQMGDQLVPFG